MNRFSPLSLQSTSSLIQIIPTLSLICVQVRLLFVTSLSRNIANKLILMGKIYSNEIQQIILKVQNSHKNYVSQDPETRQTVFTRMFSSNILNTLFYFGIILDNTKKIQRQFKLYFILLIQFQFLLMFSFYIIVVYLPKLRNQYWCITL